MERMQIIAKTRTESGKGVAKRLRAAGSLPAIAYNSKGKSTMISIDEKEFTKVWKQATPTTLVDLDIDGKKSIAFIKDTRYDIIKDRNLHVDFHVIDEDKPLISNIKVQVEGNPIGVRQGGVFEATKPTIQISCLPADLPVRIVVNVDNLALGDVIKVKDIGLDKKITVLSNDDVVVARVVKNS